MDTTASQSSGTFSSLQLLHFAVQCSGHIASAEAAVDEKTVSSLPWLNAMMPRRIQYQPKSPRAPDDNKIYMQIFFVRNRMHNRYIIPNGSQSYLVRILLARKSPPAPLKENEEETLATLLQNESASCFRSAPRRAWCMNITLTTNNGRGHEYLKLRYTWKIRITDPSMRRTLFVWQL